MHVRTTARLARRIGGPIKRLWQRLRGALGLGVLWAVGGALAGGAIELALNILPGSDLFLGVDMWPAALAIPGFLAGVAFSLVLWSVEGRRSFDELKLPRFGLLGAVGGAGLGILFGLAPVVVGALVITSGASAIGSLALARRARRNELVGSAEPIDLATLGSVDDGGDRRGR